MSAKHRTIAAIDDRVATMADLRVLVDTISNMIAAFDARLTALEDSRHAASSAPVTADRSQELRENTTMLSIYGATNPTPTS